MRRPESAPAGGRLACAEIAAMLSSSCEGALGNACHIISHFLPMWAWEVRTPCFGFNGNGPAYFSIVISGNFASVAICDASHGVGDAAWKNTGSVSQLNTGSVGLATPMCGFAQTPNIAYRSRSGDADESAE